MVRRLWTIGYEGHDPDSFVRALRKAKVERLVDVRELPLSRRAGFSKTALATGLAHNDIAYTHLRALGTPRPLRHAYKAGAPFAEFREGYLEHLEGVPRALDELEALAGEARCCVMCVERDHGTCHRGVLAEVLSRRGWTIAHL